MSHGWHGTFKPHISLMLSQELHFYACGDYYARNWPEREMIHIRLSHLRPHWISRSISAQSMPWPDLTNGIYYTTILWIFLPCKIQFVVRRKKTTVCHTCRLMPCRSLASNNGHPTKEPNDIITVFNRPVSHQITKRFLTVHNVSFDQ